MKLFRWLLVAAIIVVGAGIAKADGGDPTFKINDPDNTPTCDNITVFCISNFSNSSLSIPAGAFSDTLVYTGTSDVTALEILFSDTDLEGIAVQSNIFANVTSAPELLNNQLYELFTLSGSGPCMYNGVNDPPATCSGIISTGDVITFSTADGFATGQTITFTPEPETLGLMAIGLIALLSRRLLQKSEK
ncbi:MAG TPA: PEP-CTERM sorting domain-containing protein [Verrucomicrobiae bacterium]|nr:PEP-CTERM sorting domain-containing protein [Verrucomicrobiae bacterium]